MDAIEPGNWDRFDEIIDVRSPEEYRIDHIPGAISLPVLGDVQRSEIGTMYKKQSAFAARKKGASLVARNIALHLEHELADRSVGWRPLVYCWRGGQRSQAFVDVMRHVGWNAHRLNGGYKCYRKWVLEQIEFLPGTVRMVVLAGRTGVGKTRLLSRIQEMGAAVVDLEELACHRGSAFGVLGEQPSQKAFESGLCAGLSRVCRETFVFLEAESRKIGEIHLPGSLLSCMRAAPVVEVTASIEARAGYITSEYQDYVDSENLFEKTLRSIGQYTGRQLLENWLAMHRKGEVNRLVKEMLEKFYDIGYGHSLSRNYGRGKPLASVEVDPGSAASIDQAAFRILGAVAGRMS